MSYQVGKNIVATVTYYDVIDFPLTAFEIWKHLLTPDREKNTVAADVTLSEIWQILHSEQLSGKLAEKNGFYFLKGRESLVESRIQGEKISIRKLRSMQRLAGVLSYLPYLRMIGVTGSLAMKNGERGSDWDMFVVMRSGKIWIGRTILTVFLHVIGKRRHGKKISNRACLNYFVTEESLEIATKDLFSAHEYRFLIPLLSFPLFQIFELKNRWIREYKPNFSPTVLPNLWLTLQTPRALLIRRSLERWFDMFDLEQWLASWQKKKIAENPKTRMEGSLIEASDRSLVFLPEPQGPRVFQKFKERLTV